MHISELWTNNGGVRLHGLTNAPDASNTDIPVLFIPGLWGEAAQFQPVLKLLYPRKAYVLSLRGRGSSDVPERGYTFADHVSDIQAFVEQTNLARFDLISVSAGATYAIGYAARDCSKIRTLVLTDYPPISKSYPPDIIQGVLRNVKDVKVSETFLRGIQRESQSLDLSGELKKISSDVVILKGQREGSYLSEESLETYRKYLKHYRIQPLAGIAHDPLENVESFVAGIAASQYSVV
jgi:pimeloyl-ACP methyl ester carboxylesterase